MLETQEMAEPCIDYEENLEFLFEKLNPSQSEIKKSNSSDAIIQKFEFNDKSITPVLVYTFPSLGLRYRCWTSALHLSRYLECHQNAFLSTEIERIVKILDIGSGTGIVGIAASKLFGHHVQVTVTDVAEVVPNMMKNIEINRNGIDNITAAPLVWGEKITNADFLHQDFILASDVIYYEELFDILIQTLVELTESGNTKVIIAAEKRKRVENRFWKRAAKYFVVKVVEQIADESCEHGYVTIYSLMRKENAPQYQKPNLHK